VDGTAAGVNLTALPAGPHNLLKARAVALNRAMAASASTAE